MRVDHACTLFILIICSIPRFFLPTRIQYQLHYFVYGGKEINETHLLHTGTLTHNILFKDNIINFFNDCQGTLH